MSAINCIEVKQYDIYNDYINNEIKKKIEEKIKNNEIFSNDWFILILDDFSGVTNNGFLFQFKESLKRLIKYRQNIPQFYEQEFDEIY